MTKKILILTTILIVAIISSITITVLNSATAKTPSQSNSKIIYYDWKFWTDYSVTGKTTNIFWSGEQAYTTLDTGVIVKITNVVSLIHIGSNYTFDLCLGDHIFMISELNNTSDSLTRSGEQ